jgi:UDP-N-acetylglucosamine--N-acetylmuramyl-(pentapeptide) pyrophosphoryl-undecaprenol N-acetylglucosamine transferase
VKILFAGGGTGGHVYPAIAIADALRLLRHAPIDRWDITFVGTRDRIEATIVPKAGYPLATIVAKPLARKLSSAMLVAPFANAIGVLQSLVLLVRIKPDMIVATGGYVCFPLVVAAKVLRSLKLLHAPIALLEPNARPGLTNRLLAPLVDEVWGAAQNVDPRFTGKYARTGVPVRASLEALPPREEAIARLGLDQARLTLLAMGGSLGAARINDAIAWFSENGVPDGWQILLVAGIRDAQRLASQSASNPLVHIVAYLDDPADAYAVADLVLARAGASTVAELAAVGAGAILVPYPFAADDHQDANARAVEATGAAVVVRDAELNGPRLAALFAGDGLLLDRVRLAARSLAGADATSAVTARIAALLARIPPVS